MLLKQVDLFLGHCYRSFDGRFSPLLFPFKWERAFTDSRWSVKQSAVRFAFTTVIPGFACSFAMTWSSWCQWLFLGCCHVHLRRLGSWKIDPITEKWFWEQNSRRIKPLEFIFPVLCFPNTSGHSSQSQPTRAFKSPRTINLSCLLELTTWLRDS